MKLRTRTIVLTERMHDVLMQSLACASGWCEHSDECPEPVDETDLRKLITICKSAKISEGGAPCGQSPIASTSAVGKGPVDDVSDPVGGEQGQGGASGASVRGDDANASAPAAGEEAPCQRCGGRIGNPVFTVCDACWDACQPFGGKAGA